MVEVEEGAIAVEGINVYKPRKQFGWLGEASHTGASSSFLEAEAFVDDEGDVDPIPPCEVAVNS